MDWGRLGLVGAGLGLGLDRGRLGRAGDFAGAGFVKPTFETPISWSPISWMHLRNKTNRIPNDSWFNRKSKGKEDSHLQLAKITNSFRMS
ncbi:hypothetical protein BY996DRAFT_6463880 [Phakopsora pachyrhizi]|nr:hypothetical protein BY996DRAFT_6463880 [Phakopsora pachyrhizi]